MWHCVDAEGRMHIVADPVPDKNAAATMMGAMFELLNIVRYVFIDEAWMVRTAFLKQMTGKAEIPADLMVREYPRKAAA